MTMGDRIKALRLEHHMTLEELGKVIGVQKSAIRKYEAGQVENIKRSSIERLARVFDVSPGYLMFGEDKQESAASKHPSYHRIPVLGEVRAGVPISAVEDILDYEQITEDMARTGEYFALRLKGDSMEPKMSEGDVVIVRIQPTVENGEIAVVFVIDPDSPDDDPEATVKKFYRSGDSVTLVSFNPAYEPFVYDLREVEISVLGRVVELRAKFG